MSYLMMPYGLPVILTIHYDHNNGEFRPAWNHGCNYHPCLKLGQGPVSLEFFSRNSNSMETSPCHNSVAGHQIAAIFSPCHDSIAVVPCTKFCSDHCIRIEGRVKRNFHRIGIAMEKTLVKRAPDPIYRKDLEQTSRDDCKHKALTRQHINCEKSCVLF